ncbi:epimerase [Bacillus sp. HMSC76G11]|uniref:TIGR01777 family protein n=1 Tax=Metabacillus idriensis TaxID=324768 RepID=A0A6I2M9B2_9BACI|nr:TIGR01777 family oxidoreductase [Metabacillus idriensis]MRX54925.1 TIGR01777 family protein [Metabacillus idriensis]OHR71388.1 epimerase [Bacillus sp. HMSC76G11]
MKIAISGGTGFVGKKLTDYLLENGDEVLILSRTKKESTKPGLKYVELMTEGAAPERELEGINAFINLAGKSINDRWTEESKKQIVESRVKTTREVYRIIDTLKKKPEVLINASAVGIYGTSKEETFTEESRPNASDFLSETVIKWEKEAAKISELGVRTVFTRFGIILGEKGALPSIVLPYKLFAGGTVGSGTQWLSWIHINDVVKLIHFLLHQKSIEGPVNAASPNPVQMKDFGKTVAKVLHRPHWVPAPSFALKLALGEKSILVLEGQRVIPKAALENHFQFSHPVLEEALSDILKST